MLITYFDKSELCDLCFDLDIDYEELRGERKGDKARELITYLERRNRLSDLLEVGKRLRPDVPWDDALATD